ncbi:MAG: hypothetical protein ACPL1B_09035, partial [Thermoprotei archaeon]
FLASGRFPWVSASPLANKRVDFNSYKPMQNLKQFMNGIKLLRLAIIKIFLSNVNNINYIITKSNYFYLPTIKTNERIL